MPLSFAALQIYDQYLTTYRADRGSRYDIHGSDKLKKIYSTIQWNGRFHPEFLTQPSSDEIYSAVSLKEQACSFKHALSSIKEETLQNLFAKKISYSSEPDLVTVSFHEESHSTPPDCFSMEVTHFATPQKNIGSFLTDDQPVMLPEGTYSFDLRVNQKNYELQFRIQPDITHKELQEKLVRLINHSALGISASLLADSSNYSRHALMITSDSVGECFDGSLYFDLTDDETSMQSGIVHYLGLNREIIPPRNMTYEIDGEIFTSYANELDLFDSYHLVFHPEKTVYDKIDHPVTIGVYPDLKSIEQNIQTYVKSYNHFMKNLEKSTPVQAIYQDFRKITALQRSLLVDYGINQEADATLTYGNMNEAKFHSTEKNPLYALQQYGSSIENRLDDIILDPMKYLNRRICSYKNPGLRYINPYETSIYTGLLFQTYI